MERGKEGRKQGGKEGRESVNEEQMRSLSQPEPAGNRTFQGYMECVPLLRNLTSGEIRGGREDKLGVACDVA